MSFFRNLQQLTKNSSSAERAIAHTLANTSWVNTVSDSNMNTLSIGVSASLTVFDDKSSAPLIIKTSS